MEEAFARLNREVMRLSTRLRRIEKALGVGQAAAGKSPNTEHQAPSTVTSAWQSAPLLLRLRFAQELLHADHPLQPALKDAAALEDLRRRGRDLEAWLTNYPALFVEAVSRVGVWECAHSHTPGSAAETLAAETLAEACQTLDASLAALGLEWIAPEPGSPITEEHEVVDEEEVAQKPGTVARLRRPGFRWQGRLYQPAQVLRARAKSERLVVSGSAERTSPTTHHLPLITHQPDRWPDWLRRLHQRGFGQDSPQADAVFDALARLAEAAQQADPLSALRDPQGLEPLLALLGPRYAAVLEEMPEAWRAAFEEARGEMQVWLREALGITLVSPASGEAFDAATMEAVGTRRTAHPREDGTVARVERIGLQQNGQTLFRAQVVRYIME